MKEDRDPLFLLQIQVYHEFPNAYTKFEQNISINEILGKDGRTTVLPYILPHNV